MGERVAFTRARGGGFNLRLNADERALVARLLDEFAALLTNPVDPSMTERLFPVVHPNDQEQEAEYQRLMRDELVASRLAGIATVQAVLDGTSSSNGRSNGKSVTFDETQLSALMQALNGIRLVLGTLLDINDDEEDLPENALAPEYQLYAYLSWVLDSAVHVLSGI